MPGRKSRWTATELNYLMQLRDEGIEIDSTIFKRTATVTCALVRDQTLAWFLTLTLTTLVTPFLSTWLRALGYLLRNASSSRTGTRRSNSRNLTIVVPNSAQWCIVLRTC